MFFCVAIGSCELSYSLNSSKGGYIGIIEGSIIGLIGSCGFYLAAGAALVVHTALGQVRLN